MNFERNKDLFAGLFCEIIGLVFFFSLDTSGGNKSLQSQVGGVIYPRICAGGLMLLGAGLLIQWLFSRRGGKVGKQQAAGAAFDWKEYLPQAACLALILVWIMLIVPLGFIVATMLYIPCQMILLSLGEKHNWIAIAVCTVVVPIAVYYLFTNVFAMMIPMGILKDLLM